MAKLTLEGLRRLRDENRKAMELRDNANKDVQVIVGMDTCGIAAGAKEVFATFVDTVAEKGLTNVLVRQSGCMGRCAEEPTVEVVVPGLPTVVYGRVAAAVAKEIVERHILGREIVAANVLDKSGADSAKGE